VVPLGTVDACDNVSQAKPKYIVKVIKNGNSRLIVHCKNIDNYETK